MGTRQVAWFEVSFARQWNQSVNYNNRKHVFCIQARVVVYRCLAVSRGLSDTCKQLAICVNGLDMKIGKNLK